jgi:hypothetical protein
MFVDASAFVPILPANWMRGKEPSVKIYSEGKNAKNSQKRRARRICDIASERNERVH